MPGGGRDRCYFLTCKPCPKTHNMALSHAFNKLGPMSVQVTAGVLGCMTGSACMMAALKKPMPKTTSPEWRAKMTTSANPLRDPTGALNKKPVV